MDTPFLAESEHDEWMRLHPLARDFLLARFEELPEESREIYHCRAYHWYARRDRFHEGYESQVDEQDPVLGVIEDKDQLLDEMASALGGQK